LKEKNFSFLFFFKKEKMAEEFRIFQLINHNKYKKLVKFIDNYLKHHTNNELKNLINKEYCHWNTNLFMIAINTNNVAIVKLLLKYGADTNKSFKNNSPLKINIKSNIPIESDDYGNYNIKNENPIVKKVFMSQIMKLLLDNPYGISANPNFMHNNGKYVLDYFFEKKYEYNSEFLLKILLEYGTNPNIIYSLINLTSDEYILKFHQRLHFFELLFEYEMNPYLNNFINVRFLLYNKSATFIKLYNKILEYKQLNSLIFII
jgi:hypothetical protein